MDDYYGDPRNYDPNRPEEEDPYLPPAPASPAPEPASDSREAPMGLSFWNARGYPNNKIFGPNGQLLPGWTRTAQGYMFEPPLGSGGQSQPEPSFGGGGGYYDDDPFTPQFGDAGSGPDYSRMLPFSPYREMAPLQIDPFTPSSWEDAEQEPGFTKSQDRLSKQVQNSAAYRGVLRSGMTIGGLDSVLDSNRQQNFAQFDARRFRNWDANAGVKANTWAANAGENSRFNTHRFNTERESFSDALQRWQEQVRSLTQLAQPRD